MKVGSFFALFGGAQHKGLVTRGLLTELSQTCRLQLALLTNDTHDQSCSAESALHRPSCGRSEWPSDFSARHRPGRSQTTWTPVCLSVCLSPFLSVFCPIWGEGVGTPCKSTRSLRTTVGPASETQPLALETPVRRSSLLNCIYCEPNKQLGVHN